jgi:membrane associated rhomboid family serine protease
MAREVQIQIPSPGKLFTPAVTVIMVLSVLGFVAWLLKSGSVLAWLVLNPQRPLPGLIWQLFTYPFVFPDPLSLLLDLAIILVIGGAIERQWGTKTFVLFWLFVSVLSGLLWVLVGALMSHGIPGIGSGACCYAMVAVFGLIFPDRRFLLMMTTVDAKTIALIMLGISFILNLRSPINLIWMLAAGLGYAFVKLRERSLYAQARSSTGDSAYQPSSFVDID